MNYQRCYLEILDNDPSVDNFKLTATALMDIQEPEEAIQYYEKALEKDSENLNLIREVGHALVMTHDYNRAIKYYEQSLHEDPSLFDLRIDLAELYIKLKAFDDSKRVLIEALKSIKQMKDDIDNKTRNVDTLLLLSKVYLDEDMQGTDWKFKANPDAKQALIEASKTQSKVIEACRELSSDRLDEERDKAAGISFKLGKYYEERDGNQNDAIACFNDCLQRNNQHKEAIVSIARIHQSMGHNDQCEQFCNRVLQIDKSNEEATYMKANLMLMAELTDKAMKSYKDLLDKEPDHHNILGNLIELMRRAGSITDISKYLENAELKTQRSKMAGLNYCKGLYSRYNSEPQKALRELNFARFDNFFGGKAIQNMIEIYLNPANDMIYSSILETDYATTTENI